MSFKTEQEAFWAGEFGNEYNKRNQGAGIVASNLALFSKVLASTRGISTVVEYGANIGLNIQALKQLLPQAQLSGVEINEAAANELRKQEGVTVYNESILDFVPPATFDFAFIKTVLIHINPDELDRVYKLLYESSHKYICVIEYYNPSPVQVNYRGNTERLFKRDFAGDILDKYPDVQLVDYGFVYRRDNVFPQDDMTWFLLQKK